MNGKNRCRILKDIRRRIAEENGIEYAVSECKHKGDCLGTCPKCEAEVRYLENELAKRRSLGYKVSVVGLAAGITLASSGCAPINDWIKEKLGTETQGDMAVEEWSEVEVSATAGDLAVYEDEDLMGEEPPEYDGVLPEEELMGDIAT